MKNDVANTNSRNKTPEKTSKKTFKLTRNTDNRSPIIESRHEQEDSRKSITN